MKASTKGRGYGPARLKAAVLAVLDERIRVCADAERKYAALAQEPNGGILGSVEIAKLSEATERSARLEVELIRRHVAGLPVRGEAVFGKGER